MKQAVLWNGTLGLAPVDHVRTDGVAVVPLVDMPPSRLVLAWNTAGASPLIRSFVTLAAAQF